MVYDFDNTTINPPTGIDCLDGHPRGTNCDALDEYLGTPTNLQYRDPTGHGSQEVIFANGDSGGPNFVTRNGFRKLAGITSHIHSGFLKTDLELGGGNDLGNFGEIGVVMRTAFEPTPGEDPGGVIDGHLDWIEGITGIKPPQVTGIKVMAGSPSPSLHGPHDVLDGYDPAAQKARQLIPVPIAKANFVEIAFSEGVDLSGAALALSGIQGINYTATLFSYDPVGHKAVWQVTPPLADTNKPDQVEFALSGVVDVAGVRLDGEWNNPDSLNDSTVDSFPSGDGSADGANNFTFRLNFIVADFNRDNVIDGSDFGIWNSHKFTLTNPVADGFYQGDANGDNAVDGSDFGIWNSYKFTYWHCWRGHPTLGCAQSSPPGSESFAGSGSTGGPSVTWMLAYRRLLARYDVFVNEQINQSLSLARWQQFTDELMELLGET